MSVSENRHERVEAKVRRLGVVLCDRDLRMEGVEGGYRVVSGDRVLLPPEEPGLPLHLVELALNTLLTDHTYLTARVRIERERTGYWLRRLDGAMALLSGMVRMSALP